MMNHLLGIRFNQRISSVYLTLPEHNSRPVRAAFEPLGAEKLESDNCNIIYKKMVQNNLQYPFITIPVFHTHTNHI